MQLPDRASIIDKASQMEGCCSQDNVDSSIFSSSRSWNCTFVAADLGELWKLHRSLRRCCTWNADKFFLRSATEASVRFPYLSGRAGQGGCWGIHQVAVTWLAGEESWEFISGQQNRDQSVPESPGALRTQRTWWKRWPLKQNATAASIQRGHVSAVDNYTTDYRDK